jgi:hypothetical protein
MNHTNIDQHAIRTRAHELWQERGCPLGSADADWLRAEQELRAAAAARSEGSSKPEPPAPTRQQHASAAAQKSGTDRSPKSGKGRIRDLSGKPGAASATRLLAVVASRSTT